MRSIILYLIVPLFSITSFADSYFLYPINGKSSSQDLKESFSDLLSSAISETNNEVTESRQSAHFLVKSKLIRLGGSYIASVTKYNSKKKKLFSTKMKASSAEELDKVANRLARALVKESKAENEIRIGEVTDKEEQQVAKRTKSLNLKTFGVGPAIYTNLKDSGVGTLLSFGYLWEVTPNAAIKLSTEFSTKLKSPWSAVGGVNIGANYYISKSTSSLYLTGDFGYGGAVEDNPDLSSSWGFTLGVGAGFNFFRTAEKQMSIAFRYLTVLEKNEEGLPGHLGLILAVHY